MTGVPVGGGGSEIGEGDGEESEETGRQRCEGLCDGDEAVHGQGAGCGRDGEVGQGVERERFLIEVEVRSTEASREGCKRCAVLS